MLFRHAIETISTAEVRARNGCSLEEALQTLRRLSLDEFGWLLITMPNREFPALSKLLPRMTSPEIQERWTGSHGVALFKQTSTFCRTIESQFCRFTGRSLSGGDPTILDYGVGYGRLFRMLYYFNDPHKLFGVDAWQGSLDLATECGVVGNFKKIDASPVTLPFDGVKFDLVYAFSVITHISESATLAMFAAVRKGIKDDGLFIASVRPEEQWQFNRDQGKEIDVNEMVSLHRTKGFVFNPIGRGEDYGDTSISFDFLRRVPHWNFVGYDLSIIDPYQILALFKPA